MKFTVHVVQSFIKGHRKSGVISIKHSRDMTNRISWNNVRFLPYYDYSILQDVVAMQLPIT